MTESSFHFHGYQLTDMEFHVAQDFTASPQELSQSTEVEPTINEEDPDLVDVTLKVSIVAKSEKLLLKLAMTGSFQREKGMPDEAFEQMYRVNAPAILYPFARAVVGNITAQAGMPALIMPVVNFVPHPTE